MWNRKRGGSREKEREKRERGREDKRVPLACFNRRSPSCAVALGKLSPPSNKPNLSIFAAVTESPLIIKYYSMNIVEWEQAREWAGREIEE